MSLKRLIRKWKNLDEIPQDNLVEEGYARYEGKIVSIDRLSQKQLAEVLNLAEFMGEEDESDKEKDIKRLISRAQLKIDQEMPHVPRTVGFRLKAGIEKWVDEHQDAIPYMAPQMSALKLEEIPHVRAAATLNSFYSGTNPAYRDNFLKWLENRGFDFSEINTGSLTDKRNEFIRGKLITLKKNREVHPLREEFEAKHGAIDYCQYGRFMSYVLRKELLNEEDPKEFWGKELPDLQRKFVEQFKRVEGIERFAERLYSTEAGFGVDRVFNTDSLEIDLEGTLEGLPLSVKEFEQLRKGHGTAVGFIKTPSFYIDSDYLSDKNTRDVLEAIQEAEFGNFKNKALQEYDYLDKFVKNRGKKIKIARLCKQSKDFTKFVEALCQGKDSYVDSIKENKKVTKELKSLGVKTKIFYNGLSAREFAVSDGKTIGKEELRGDYLQMYQKATNTIFFQDVLHGADRLEQKLRAGLKQHVEESKENPVSLEKILQSEDDNIMSRVCSIAMDYASREQNIKNAQQVAAATHHLRNMRRFLNGKFDEEASEGSVIYSVRIAKKNPFTDVDIGNDGGCCIGIYGSEAEGGNWEREYDPQDFISYLQGLTGLPSVHGNGIYIPFYLKDRATQFAEIYNGKDRVGMALMFAGRNEKNEPLLLVNSIELSDKLKADSNKGTVSSEVVSYIKNYGAESGFKETLMGAHVYNPASSIEGDTIDYTEIAKIHPWDESFYSDVINPDGKSRNIFWKKI